MCYKGVESRLVNGKTLKSNDSEWDRAKKKAWSSRPCSLFFGTVLVEVTPVLSTFDMAKNTEAP